MADAIAATKRRRANAAALRQMYRLQENASSAKDNEVVESGDSGVVES